MQSTRIFSQDHIECFIVLQDVIIIYCDVGTSMNTRKISRKESNGIVGIISIVRVLCMGIDDCQEVKYIVSSY